MPQRMMAGHATAWRDWPLGGARPVLAVHCSLAHGGAWSALAGLLSGLTLTVPDLPGHGKSADWDGVQDLHALATRVTVALAEQLGGGGPIDLIGHSFGGTVCLRLALERPDLVRSLVLIEPVLFVATKGQPVFDCFAADDQAMAGALVHGQRAEAAAAFHAIWGAGEPLATLPPHQQAYIRDRIHLIPALSPVVAEDGPGLTVPGRLEGLTRPVLLIEGGDSPPIIGAIQSVLERRLPDTQRLIVPGAGHMVPLTHAAQIAPAIQAHLDAV